MASPVLHIKDSYYFEVPKSLWPVHKTSKSEYTGAYETWLRLDPQFQHWEALRFYDEYARLKDSPAPKDELVTKYLHWKEEHVHTGKPFWRFLSEEADHAWFVNRDKSSQFHDQWQAAIERTSGHGALIAFRNDASTEWNWSSEKLASYSNHLSGKILIPQPFGRLRNLYQKDWGVCISRFMIIELFVAIAVILAYTWLARKVSNGERPRGGLWNLLEAFVVFVRDDIARPVIGHHESSAVLEAHPEAMEPLIPDIGGHSHHAAEHAQHGDRHPSHAPPKPPGEDYHESDGHDDPHHDPRFDADRFVPLLLTIFFFVLGCNLAGILPWVGAPSGEWGATSAIAIVTFATGIIYGMRRFGLFGYFLNQIPPMDVPLFMLLVLKPMIFLIEMLGLCIKHAILSVRLLANMVAGHIVLLSIMALAFSLEGASSNMWNLTAVISIVGSVLLSCLELFVAFLQAYIFTFLSAMFIGAAIHSH